MKSNDELNLRHSHPKAIFVAILWLSGIMMEQDDSLGIMALSEGLWPMPTTKMSSSIRTTQTDTCRYSEGYRPRTLKTNW